MPIRMVTMMPCCARPPSSVLVMTPTMRPSTIQAMMPMMTLWSLVTNGPDGQITVPYGQSVRMHVCPQTGEPLATLMSGLSAGRNRQLAPLGSEHRHHLLARRPRDACAAKIWGGARYTTRLLHAAEPTVGRQSWWCPLTLDLPVVTEQG